MLSRILSPFRNARRLLWGLLAWSNRHVLGLWFRSLRDEARQPFDIARTGRLVRSLLKVTTDTRLANTAELRSLRIVDDTVVAETDPQWRHRGTVRTVLEGVNRVNRVDFVDAPSITGTTASPAA